MSKVIWHVTMSLDGFIAGPDHAMEWAFEQDWPSPMAENVKETTGAILAGRGWHDGADGKYGGVDGIYGGAWSGPVFVLTHRPDEPPRDPKATFLSDGLEDAVATAREAAREKNLEIFGANLAAQCLEAGLIDEIVIHLAPLLLGDGIRLYGAAAKRVDLERVELAESRQLTDLRFRVLNG